MFAPQKAVLREANGTPYVYLIGDDGNAVRRIVTIEKAIGTDWYVTDGLKVGEKIIMDGVNNVRSGMPVQEVAPEAMQKDTQAGGGK